MMIPKINLTNAKSVWAPYLDNDHTKTYMLLNQTLYHNYLLLFSIPILLPGLPDTIIAVVGWCDTVGAGASPAL